MPILKSSSLLLIATICAALYCLPNQSIEAKQTQAKRTVLINNLRFPDALAQLAKTYDVVIGLEEILQSSEENVLTLSLEQASISEALNQLIKADPRYEWRSENDGAIRVQSLKLAPAMGDLLLRSFAVKNLYRKDVSKLLDQQSDIHSWLTDHNCERVEFTTGHDWDSDSKQVSLYTTGKTLRQNLDLVALESKTYFWEIVHTDGETGCRISIKL